MTILRHRTRSFELFGTDAVILDYNVIFSRVVCNRQWVIHCVRGGINVCSFCLLSNDKTLNTAEPMTIGNWKISCGHRSSRLKGEGVP